MLPLGTFLNDIPCLPHWSNDFALKTESRLSVKTGVFTHVFDVSNLRVSRRREAGSFYLLAAGEALPVSLQLFWKTGSGPWLQKWMSEFCCGKSTCWTLQVMGARAEERQSKVLLAEFTLSWTKAPICWPNLYTSF